MNLRVSKISIPQSEIAGLFDLDAITVEKTTRKTLELAQAAASLYDCCDGELPRSLVLACAQNRPARYYLAAPNTVTLYKRMRAFR